MKRILKKAAAMRVATVLLALALGPVAPAAAQTDYPVDSTQLAAWQLPFSEGTTWEIESDAADHRTRYPTGYSIDYILTSGESTGVYAPFSGIVTQTTQSVLAHDGADGCYTREAAQRYGNFVQLIDPASGYSALFAHMANGSVPFARLEPGTPVEQGTYLGIVSNTRSEDRLTTILNHDQISVHLHVEINVGIGPAALTLDPGVRIGPHLAADLVIGNEVSVGGVAQPPLKALYEAMRAGDYAAAAALLSSGRYEGIFSTLLGEKLYLYDGRDLSANVEGTGLVLRGPSEDNPALKAFYGEFADGLPNGQCAAVFFSPSGKSQYTVTGAWQNGLLNGPGTVMATKDESKIEKQSGKTYALYIEETGHFADGLYDGAFTIAWHMDAGSCDIHLWSATFAAGVAPAIRDGDNVMALCENCGRATLGGAGNLKAARAW